MYEVDLSDKREVAVSAARGLSGCFVRRRSCAFEQVLGGAAWVTHERNCAFQRPRDPLATTKGAEKSTLGNSAFRSAFVAVLDARLR